MNFIEQITKDLNNDRNRRGMTDQVVLNARCVRELLHHFKELDSAERALHEAACTLGIHQQLHNLIIAAYHQKNRNAETTLMLIMDTLRPLMEERNKEIEIISRFER